MKTNLSIEELLAKATEATKPKRRIENNKNTLRYIEETCWEAGTLAIPTYVIFWHYRNVWKCDRHYKANKTVFFRTFNKKFPAYRKHDQRYYLLKEGIIELNEEILKEAKAYDKQHWKKKEKTKNSDRESQTAVPLSFGPEINEEN
jgi:hypothetical protein